MKVAINVRVRPGASGGIGPAVRSLITALGSLPDGDEEYVLVVRSQDQIEWLSPISARQRFVLMPPSSKRSMARRAVGKALSLAGIQQSPQSPYDISDGFFESLGCDVVHFPTQGFVLCAVPSVYNPHDLQHLHYPQFFSPQEIAFRDAVYRAGCHFAQTVIVNSQWIKEDVTRQYGVFPSKLQVIPEAPPTALNRDSSNASDADVRAKYALSDPFAFYPSVTWPHKNHLRLLDALAYLRDERGLRVPLVCTGSRYEPFWPQVEAKVVQLGLSEQVRFLGYVPDQELAILYRLARCLVLPTLFEANSLPIFEAWLEGTPVACSNVTALPEQLMDAGLLFDPLDPVSIAHSLERLFTDARLREALSAEGHDRLRDFDWSRTARAYRAVYRRAAGRRLSDEDRELLAWDWMRAPRRMMEVKA